MNVLKSKIVTRFLADYGMILVLVALCVYYSWATYGLQQLSGAEAARALAGQVTKAADISSQIVVAARKGDEEMAFGNTLTAELKRQGYTAIREVEGEPFEIRQTLKDAVDSGQPVAVIATTGSTASVLPSMLKSIPALADTPVISPQPYHWPTFLMGTNLVNVMGQIVVYAIIGIGMTLVIITGGIDLSVGSLVALSAVIAAWLVQHYGGGTHTSTATLVVCCIAAVVVCGVVGAFSGVMVSFFRIPPFIATLGMMQVARGFAFILSDGQSYADFPAAFTGLWKMMIWSIPNAIFLMIGVYIVAHIVMSRTSTGRYIYAVGGNIEAARLSGVPVRMILLLVYVVCGAAAGLGGVVMASQLKSAAPQYGGMFELSVIAAVVVGGTSLSGGSGKIIGTLIGALIIAVIANGMNLTNVGPYPQIVVLGVVILGAVLLDMLRKHGRRIFAWG
jgi:ribose transport system permease protein